MEAGRRIFSPEAEVIYYIYVVDEQETLLGVVSLRDIIVNPPDTVVENIMKTEILTVKDSGTLKEVVELVAKYDMSTILGSVIYFI